MKTTTELLKELRLKLAEDQRKPIEKVTNYAIAKYLNQSETAVARWDSGKGSFSDDTCAQFAKELDYDVGYVLACIKAEREKDATLRKAWERLANLAIAASVLLIIGGVSIGMVPSGEPVTALLTSSNTGALYIMSNAVVEYWPIILPLFFLLLWAFPRRIRAPQEPDKLAE